MTAEERRLEALLRLLTEEGHMTPYARSKVVDALADRLRRASPGSSTDDLSQRPNNPCWRCGASD